MFPPFSLNDPLAVEALQATPTAMKQLARMAIEAIARTAQALRPDLLIASLRTMLYQ
jgi:hypothetical protein